MRLLAIQELPQSKRVKLVFDDDTVLKTQPYLLADFGLVKSCDDDNQWEVTVTKVKPEEVILKYTRSVTCCVVEC